MAIDQPGYPNPTNPATIGTAGSPGPTTPAMMALPANATPLATDIGSVRKFYTLTASLREIYDDNVNTSNVHPESSFETQISPSVLVDFPKEDSDFSARYTFNLTYYSQGGANGVANQKNSTDYTHEFVAQYAHSFSQRFQFNVAEQFRYYTEPSLFDATGTLYRSGAYVSNILNGTFSAQWTPLLGSTTTYSNTVIRYDDSVVALAQNNIENTGSHSFNFAILPKVSLSVGGIVDNVDYDGDSRGYTNYTGFVGAQWQALPSLSLSGRGGASYTVLDKPQGQSQSQPQSSASPYVAMALNWTLGARSALAFNYAHEVTPTDQAGADAQSSDRFTANFRYDITTNLSSHLQAIYTISNISQSFITSSSISSYDQDDYAFDAGFTYHYTSYLSFDLGGTISGVSSQINNLDYTRDQVYIGVRGTY